MPRSLYYVGGLAAMLLVVFAPYVTGPQSPVVDPPQAATAAPADPAVAAIDELAAWPVAAGR